MVYLIDNYDSFTYNLLDYCLQFHCDCTLIRNDERSIEELAATDPDGFIFSPGPGEPKEHPLMFEILEKWYQKKPILGVCLGFQAIAGFFGASIQRSPSPVHGKVSTITHRGHAAFQGIPASFSVTRYHSLMVGNTEAMKDVSITAYTNLDRIPMALAHRQYPIWGFQYHPEAILTEHGIRMVYNWLIAHFGKNQPNSIPDA